MTRTVLVADDSATIRKIVELTFMGSDVRIESVASGEHALELLDDLSPDLVLADVVMPEPDGYELCRRIKESGAPVPVLLLTGAFEPCDVDRARACGADDHLDKPFEPEALREKVLDLLAREVVASPTPPAPETGAVAGTEADAAIPAVSEIPSHAEHAEPAGPVEITTEIGLHPAPAPAAPEGVFSPTRLAPEDIDAVARAVVERLSDEIVREIARELVPQLATTLIRERIRELETEGGTKDREDR